jgi:hypothetical protein
MGLSTWKASRAQWAGFGAGCRERGRREEVLYNCTAGELRELRQAQTILGVGGN